MQARFLLGPAGSGKTFRCLAEIRAELKLDPDGPPLILLAPKQATFQLERQLLADPELHGYARLQILSFDRLAQFALENLRVTPPDSLSEEGRVMVLRALLIRCAAELRCFDKSARRPGFAQQLSGLLSELQNHGVSAARLTELSRSNNLPEELRAKLNDLGALLGNYHQWLVEHELHDVDHLLEAATAALTSNVRSRQAEIRSQRTRIGLPASSIRPLVSGLWLDGFAEMTPAELDLLAAVLPWCERATLAFCVDREPRGEDDWLSIWRVVAKTFSRCRERLAALKGADVQIEHLARGGTRTRFVTNPALAHLESNWTEPVPFAQHATPGSAPRIVGCVDPNAEAVFAAREILKFVRVGGRYRDVAVLMRHLAGYQKTLERTFERYGIPFFLDRREGVAHHPLAELTRSALRVATFDWQHEDWFSALKAGFAPVSDGEIDSLENEALARGWRGANWRAPIQFGKDGADQAAQLERVRRKVVPPFEELVEQLARLQNKPTGEQLAQALREFWLRSNVETILENWSQGETGLAVHRTVWEQMNAWLENLALAFPREALPMRDWLPVIESGLAGLTVGVIPPALDQVLIGAIDRSRNPDLKLAFVLGFNERVFPATPETPLILTDNDREQLSVSSVELGPDLRDRLSRERYLGYIACTRASEQLMVTFSRTDLVGKELNPSPFVAHLKRLFPDVVIEEFDQVDWREAEHANELAKPLLEMQSERSQVRLWDELREIPAVAELEHRLNALQNPKLDEQLSPALAEKLFGPALSSSVSRLEEFAACPFRFFVRSGLRAEERKVFELDFREQGSFQHDVLKIFHEQLQVEGRRWRDVTPLNARERVGRIAAKLTESYRDGLLRHSPQAQFTARIMTRALQDFIEVIVGWMGTRYQFDPVRVELGFGKNGEVPAWKIDLGGGRELRLNGRIDRVDLFQRPGSDEALVVVMDYKSSAKKLDPLLLEHGVQLQLLSYLSVLRHWPEIQKTFGVARLVPAGVFYVNLRGGSASGKTRAALADAKAVREGAHSHTGRFDFGALPLLDSSGESEGEQFNFRLKKDGTPYANSAEVMSTHEFTALLVRVESQLREMAVRIFSGETKVNPYRKGTETPCRFCDYAAICRIDPWTHEYRVLRSLAEVVEESDQD